MNKYILMIFIIPNFVACSTLDQSMQIGASMGAVTGAAATYSAHRSVGETPSFEAVAGGAAIGLGVGLITSYLIHKNVSENNSSSANQPEMYFGDLPPNPFVLPNTHNKRGQ